MRLHVRGVALPDEEATELWIVDGRISREPVSGADTVFDGGWVLPGLVDAHCHVGLGLHGAIELDEAVAQAALCPPRQAGERKAGRIQLRH